MLSAIARKWTAHVAALVAAAGMVLVVGAVALIVEPCDALYWNAYGTMPCTRVGAESPNGPFALRVHDDSVALREVIYQDLAPETVHGLRGQTVTFGTWVRTPVGQQESYAQLYDGKTWHTIGFVASPEWRFFAQSFALAPDTSTIKIGLGGTDGATEAIGEVLYSGVILVPGDRMNHGAPRGIGGHEVLWDGRQLTNSLHNPTGERAIYRLKPFLDAASRKLGVTAPFVAAQLLVDPDTFRPETLRAYSTYTSVLFDSFWGQFGWMNLPLPGTWYTALLLLTLLSLAGAIRFIGQLGKSDRPTGSVLGRQVAVLNLLVGSCGFALAFLREIPPFGQSQGRYVLPLIVPLAITMCLGLHALSPKHVRSWVLVALVAFLFVLNAVSVIAVIVRLSYGLLG